MAIQCAPLVAAYAQISEDERGNRQRILSGAVIRTEPSVTPRTKPNASTVAIVVSDENQRVALSGAVDALTPFAYRIPSLVVSPTKTS